MTAVSEGLGRGSAFSFRLPMTRQTTPELPPQAPESAPSPKSHRILIVDDRRDARIDAHGLAQADGSTGARGCGRSYGTGRRARPITPKSCCATSVCLTWTDMPWRRAIRSDPALNDVCLVALTGYGRAEDRERAFKVGFDQHLTKPISQDQLMELVTRSAHS